VKRLSASDRVQRSVRASDEEIQGILDRLDAAAPDARSSLRARERFPYRVQSCSIRLEQAGVPTTSPMLAPTRNLSAGGMSFLNGGFVHAGVRCVAQLVTTDGRWIEVVGDVVRCRYVENWVHEVNVKFDSEIRPADFCKAALRMRVLLVEPDDSAAGLASHHLAPLQCEVTRVRTDKDARYKVAEIQFHVILLDTDSPDLDTAAIIRGLRQQGYTGQVVAMTSSPAPEHRERILLDGCVDYLLKPATPERLKALFDRLRQDPPTSDLLRDESMVSVVVDFLAGLPTRVRALEEAAAAEQLEQLVEVVSRLREDAGGFGLTPLADAAASVQALAGGDDAATEAVQAEVEKLVGLCMSARRATPPQTAAPAAPTDESPGAPDSPA
jgi:CheY-like chemotaxis protein